MRWGSPRRQGLSSHFLFSPSLLALCVCALGRGLPEKVLGLGQRRGGVGSPPSPSEGGGGPAPLQPPKLSHTPRGHTLAGASPRDHFTICRCAMLCYAVLLCVSIGPRRSPYFIATLPQFHSPPIDFIGPPINTIAPPPSIP